MMPVNHNYDNFVDDTPSTTQSAMLDETLVKMLKDLRRSEANSHEVPPYVIFSENSIQEMATHYPLSMEDLANISGVSASKARRYGAPFLKMIQGYVEDNDIIRPMDYVMKQVANKSKKKVVIIQGIDKKLPLDEIADSNGLSMDELLDEMDMIVDSGTKVNIDYYIEDNVDEYSLEDIFDYFMEAESGDVKVAYDELHEDDITMEEIRLVRIKFMSELGN